MRMIIVLDVRNVIMEIVNSEMEEDIYAVLILIQTEKTVKNQVVAKMTRL